MRRFCVASTVMETTKNACFLVLFARQEFDAEKSWEQNRVS